MSLRTASASRRPLWLAAGLLLSVVVPARAEHCTIRVMVAYSSDAPQSFLAAPLTTIEGWVDTANEAFANSLVSARYELARVDKVNYSKDLKPIHRWVHTDRMKDPNDGHVDRIPVQRNLYDVDMTALALPQLDSDGGVAHWVGVGAKKAFCAIPTVGTFIFAHEMAHLMGAHHQHGKTLVPAFRPWGHAFVWTEVKNAEFRTIMADGYGPDHETITHFSNPDVTVSRGGLQVATGWRALDQGADNAAVLNSRREKVARFRNLEISKAISDEVRNGELAHVIGRDSIETTGKGYEIKSGAVVTFRAGDQIVLRPGFHARSGSSFLAHLDGDFSSYCDDFVK